MLNQKFYKIIIQIEKKAVFELRCLRKEDARALDRAVEESLNELKQFLAWSHIPFTLSQREHFLEKCFEKWQTGYEFYLGLFAIENGDFLGGAGLHPRCPLNPNSLEIGYYTRTRDRGKGLATLMTQALTVASFLWVGADTVRVSCAQNNQGSIKVIEKCGFLFEGLLRNWTTAPSEEMRRGGYIASPHSLMYSFILEDIPKQRLPWFTSMAQSLSLYSQTGDPIEPLPSRWGLFIE